jgi:hypothetical protein|tara:strand:- start:2500 stop:2706 length:207 start_codon:yes stop_codon:yes gene_type:complete
MTENLTYRKLIRNLLFEHYDADGKTLDKNVKIELPNGKVYDIIYMYSLGEADNKDIILKVDEGVEDEY